MTRRLIGLISDTHGLVRPEALAALAGVERILHAGDVCGKSVIDKLEKIAPVTAVRGNNDFDDWGRTLPDTARVELAPGISAYVLHDIKDLDLDPVTSHIAAVITGHSHRPLIEESDGVLYINPGSAGPRRFNLPICLALLEIVKGRLSARIVPLSVTAQ